MTNNLTYRVSILEENYKSIDGKIDELKSNDLPHIKESVIKLGGRMETMNSNLSGKIKTMDSNLSGKISSVKTRMAILTTLQLGAIAIIIGAILNRVL